MCENIENISDQLKQYAQEAASAALDIAEQYDFKAPEAVELVKAAALAMQADALHHAEDAIREHCTQTGCISDAVNALADAVSLLPPAE